MHNPLMKRVISAEYFIAAVLVAAFYISVANFEWYWLIVLFGLFDISAMGYFINNRVGAFFYNVGHSLIGPAVLTGIYILTDNQAILFVSLLWLFHIFSDRALGFGLKHITGFHHTHLGTIGRKK